jgi:ABC-type multidrug transport system ATPase subunit
MQLHLKHIEKNFGERAILKNVNFHLRTGEVVGIFGRNGCGKSTLMKVLFGTMKANATSLYIDNTPFNPKTNISRKIIAYLPQESFLPRDIKVRNLIAMVFPDGEAQNDIFYSPGVASFENQRVGALSLGMLKYFEFLLLAHMDHPFLMLDEPFSMIDPLFHDVIKEVFTSKLKSKGILITDHYYGDVWQVAERNYIIVDGTTLEVKTIQDLATHGYLPSRNISD